MRPRTMLFLALPLTLFALPALAQPVRPPATRTPAKPAVTAPARPAARPAPLAARPQPPSAATPAASPAPRRPAPAVSPALARGPAVRARVLRRQVGLNEERASKVEKVLDKIAPERSKVQSDIREARKTLASLLHSKSQDQKAYGRALDRLYRGHRALQAIRDREYEALKQVLEPREQALMLRALERARAKAAK